MSACRNRNPSSPRNAERSGRTSSLRTSESSAADTSARSSAGRELRHRAAPELLADDRGALEHRPLERLQTVEARGEQGLDRRWDRSRDPPPRRASRPSAPRRADCPRPLRRSTARAVGGIGHSAASSSSSASDSLLRQRLERDRRAAPARALVEQVGSREAEKQDRCVAAPAGDVLEQVEERRLGPVDVLEADDERALARERLEQPPDRPERLFARGRRRRPRRRCRARARRSALRRRSASTVAHDRLVAAGGAARAPSAAGT